MSLSAAVSVEKFHCEDGPDVVIYLEQKEPSSQTFPFPQVSGVFSNLNNDTRHG
jgi:hypothetical protein